MNEDMEGHLRKLDGREGGNWITVGRVLLDLEGSSRAAPSGKPWQDVVRERLAGAGMPTSISHIYKVRRAYGFLKDQRPDALDLPVPPKISSVEISERLFRLDPEEGLKALSDALADNPASYVDLKQRYDDALVAKPEMKSARQLAWDARRSSEGSQSETTPPEADRQKALVEAVSDTGTDAYPKKFPEELRRISEAYLESIWLSGWNAAQKAAQEKVEDLRRQLDKEEEEAGYLREELREARDEIQILARKVKDLRGYPHDFDD